MSKDNVKNVKSAPSVAVQTFSEIVEEGIRLIVEDQMSASRFYAQQVARLLEASNGSATQLTLILNGLSSNKLLKGKRITKEIRKAVAYYILPDFKHDIIGALDGRNPERNIAMQLSKCGAIKEVNKVKNVFGASMNRLSDKPNATLREKFPLIDICTYDGEPLHLGLMRDELELWEEKYDDYLDVDHLDMLEVQHVNQSHDEALLYNQGLIDAVQAEEQAIIDAENLAELEAIKVNLRASNLAAGLPEDYVPGDKLPSETDSQDSDSQDGDSQDGDSQDGDSQDGEGSQDGDSQDGDSQEGEEPASVTDSQDSDSQDGDSQDGDSQDGDSQDGEPPVALTLSERVAQRKANKAEKLHNTIASGKVASSNIKNQRPDKEDTDDQVEKDEQEAIEYARIIQAMKQLIINQHKALKEFGQLKSLGKARLATVKSLIEQKKVVTQLMSDHGIDLLN